MKIANVNYLKPILLLTVVSSLLVSCLKNDDENKNEEIYKQQYLNLKADLDKIPHDTVIDAGYGVLIYYQIFNDAIKSRSLPTVNDAVLMSYNCYTSEKLIFTTDSALAKEKKLYEASVIYGPAWMELKYLLSGLYVGLPKMYDSSTASIIFPSDMAGGGVPLRFDITIHRVITNYNNFETEQRNKFMDITNFNAEVVHLAIDSTLWYKFKGTGGRSAINLYYAENLSIELTANYCEYLPGFVPVEGRQFFPINSSGTALTYNYNSEDYNFPVTPAIDSMITIMNENGYREADFITTSANTYGSTGYVHPYVGNYVIPPYKSIHYTLKWKHD